VHRFLSNQNKMLQLFVSCVCADWKREKVRMKVIWKSYILPIAFGWIMNTKYLDSYKKVSWKQTTLSVHTHTN